MDPSNKPSNLFIEYCDQTTIHGVKYLADQKRPLIERIFWILVFTASIYSCLSLIVNIWTKWNNNPVIVSFDDKSTPVWQIPFPAVTICTETKALQTKFNFTEVAIKYRTTKKVDTEEKNTLDSLLQVCYSQYFDNLTYPSLFGNATDYIKVLLEMGPGFDSTFMHCFWRNNERACNETFKYFLTEEGICYTFNSPDQSNIYRSESLLDELVFDSSYRENVQWNLENGYIESDFKSTLFPYRAMGAGAKAGLSLYLLDMEVNNDMLCRNGQQGFKVILHTPGEIPRASKQFFQVPLGQRVMMSIKPKIITTSDNLKHYDPSRRQCYFQSERYLRFFKMYTQTNCELECITNYTLSKCGCVQFSMPRNKSVPVCGSNSINCFKEAEYELLGIEFEKALENSKGHPRGQTECNCLPACTSISYDAEISQADYDVKPFLNLISLLDDLEPIEVPDIGIEMSSLSIYFKENQFISSKRSELYGTTDFLANVGGLLGLFMGISVISFTEIIYFCTIRLSTHFRESHLNKQSS